MRNPLKRKQDKKAAETVEQIDIKKLSTETLKALAYDQMLMLTQAQQNINILQAEINSRSNKNEVDITQSPPIEAEQV